MHPVRYAAAFGSIAVLTLIAALPWGLSPQDRFFLPLMPVVAIHFWGLRHPGLVPEWAAFAAGLALDILTNGPLGYWALVYLSAHLLALLGAPFAEHGRVWRIALFIATLASVTVAAWVVASLYFLEVVEPWPYLAGATLAAVSAVVLVPLMHLFDPVTDARENVRLERGV